MSGDSLVQTYGQLSTGGVGFLGRALLVRSDDLGRGPNEEFDVILQR